MGPLAFHYPFVLIHFLSLHYKLTSDAWIGCWILCIQPSVGFTFHLLLNLTNHSFWVSWESWHFIFYFLLDPILWCVYDCTGYKWTCGTLKLPKNVSWLWNWTDSCMLQSSISSIWWDPSSIKRPYVARLTIWIDGLTDHRPVRLVELTFTWFDPFTD